MTDTASSVRARTRRGWRRSIPRTPAARGGRGGARWSPRRRRRRARPGDRGRRRRTRAGATRARSPGGCSRASTCPRACSSSPPTTPAAARAPSVWPDGALAAARARDPGRRRVRRARCSTRRPLLRRRSRRARGRARDRGPAAAARRAPARAAPRADRARRAVLAASARRSPPRIARAIARRRRAPTLIVASSDMNHYLPDDETRALDEQALAPLAALDARGLWDTVRAHGITMCGYIPTTVALLAARALGATPRHRRRPHHQRRRGRRSRPRRRLRRPSTDRGDKQCARSGRASRAALPGTRRPPRRARGSPR